MLVTVGRYDPYTDDDQVHQALAGMPSASYVTDPGFGFNVLPRPCVAEVRTPGSTSPTISPPTPAPTRRD